MKKISFGFLSQLFLGLGGVALMIIGAIMFVGHFFQPDISLFQAGVLTALGAILFTSVKLYFMFLEVLNSAITGIEKITKATESYKAGKNNGFSDSPIVGVQQIVIDEDTPPEEIQKIKENFPGIADSLDRMMGQFHGRNKRTGTITPGALEMMNLTQLERELKDAVAENEFEYAAKIRDEIAKRK